MRIFEIFLLFVIPFQSLCLQEYKPVKLAYSEFEPANGTDDKLLPVIFLHGIGASKESWYNIPQHVADGTERKIYTLDSRNHGDSEYTEEFFVNANIDDVFHFMDTIQIDKAIILGHSMGALTAMKAAITKPERIPMIIVEEMIIGPLTKGFLAPIKEITSIWIEIVESIPAGLNKSEALKFAITELFKNKPPNMFQVNDIEILGNTRLILKSLPDGKYGVNFNKDMIISALSDPKNFTIHLSGEYKGSAYFICGSLSPLKVIKTKDEIEKYFPNAEFLVVERATHGVHMEFPDIFENMVLNILKNFN